MGDEVVDTPFGQFLINPQDCVGSTLKAGTLWDGPGFLQPILEEYGQLGEWGSTILDVGANIGSFSIYAAHREAWRVIAVEPVPETRRYLRANLDLNKATCAATVIVIETAAYHERGWLTPAGFEPTNLGATALVNVGKGVGAIPAVPLDEYRWCFGRRVALVKIDAQGCDGAAIVGLQQTIQRDHPAIVFEWEADLADAHPFRFREICALLEAQGYQIQAWPSQPNNFLAVPS